ncbi:PREDICTED: reverse mRNAase [Prunus dulcis]|uniref:PREDICTED: reverse mRNAase n=1 Tax=Prunus dulcis TaxID=3755 RepID=A0A5E4GP96_PRUDU|nr:PREDICTED: reverse mRNAase [Prunus dulcis]
MGWSEQFLSQAGKEILIKAVAMAMPNYAMSCFKLLVSLCKEIEKDIARYWWHNNKAQKGIHWHPESLLAQVLHDKYHYGVKYLEAGCGKGSSWGWKGIIQGRKVLEARLRWRIGNGEPVRIKEDGWLPKPYTFKEAQLILATVTSRWGCPDRQIWHFTKHGGYTVKSSYDLAIKLRRNGVIGRKGEGECSNQSGQSGSWKRIWALQVPPKIRMFIWLCCRNVAAVRENLRRRHVDVEADCPLCGNSGETEVHLFFRCEIARLFWFASPLQLDAHGVKGEDFLSCWEWLLQKFAQVDQMDEILQMVNEYREALLKTKMPISELQRPPDNPKALRRIWQKPPSGVVKANCDGAWEAQRKGKGLAGLSGLRGVSSCEQVVKRLVGVAQHLRLKQRLYENCWVFVCIMGS